MAGRIFRNIIGGGSSSGRSHRDDDDTTGDDTTAEQVVIPTVEEEHNYQIILSQDKTKGHWWTSKTIKKYVTWSFTQSIQSEYFTKWGEASESQRMKMWNYFTSHVKSIDPGYNPWNDWQRYVTRRITQLVGGLQYCKNKPDWCPQTWWEMLRDRKEKDPKWAEISRINKANRMSGAIDGKALATHTLGRKSVSDVCEYMGEGATPYKVFEKTKKNKKGEWITPRAKQLAVDFQSEIDQQSAGGGTPDEYAAYYKAAKGYDKKSRLFGQGEEVARHWYKPPCNKSERRSFSYQPTEVTQLSQQVQTLKESQEQMLREQEQWRLHQQQQQEQWRLQQEQFAAMQAAWAQMQSSQPPGSCSGFRPQRRDDFTDDGHGFGGSVEPLG